MSDRDVLVHACFSQALGEPQPTRCRCRKRLTLEEAQRLVARGELDFLIVGYREGRALTTNTQVVGTLKRLRVPRATVCDPVHIERAAGMTDDERAEEERARLEILAELNFEFFRALLIPWRPEFDERADIPAVQRLGD